MVGVCSVLAAGILPLVVLLIAIFVCSSGRDGLSGMVAAALGSKSVVALRAAAADVGADGVVV